jgi:DNA-binding NtrC family response regulator
MDLPDNDENDMICESQNRKGSVLVADGDNHISDTLSAVMDRMGYDVAVSNNGEEALDLFLKSSFDIVFTVLKMPGMDGLTLSLQVKATSLNTPVVLILDDHLKSIMNRIKAGRIDCVMSKPLSFGEIQKAVQYFETNRSRVSGSAQPPA